MCRKCINQSSTDDVIVVVDIFKADFAPPDRIRSLFNSLKGGDKSCKLLEQICPSGGGKSAITRRWIARYTLILSGQGVLISKGYLVSLSIADQ